MDKKLIALLSIFFLSFLLFISVLVFNKPLTQLTRATEDIEPSSTNSLIFAWPLTAKADGTSKVSVNVFVRSESNKLVTQKTVTLRTSLGDIENVSSVSDENGKTTFTLTSQTPGVAELSAVIDGATPVQKKLTVKFE